MIPALALLLAAEAAPAHMAEKPAIGPLPALRLQAPTTFTLPNGLRVIAVPRHAAPIVALQLVVRSGADADPPALAGLAAATADMMDEGAGDRDALAVARDLEALGAELFLGASRDGSVLSLNVPSPGFEAALAIAADVALRPRFAEADWARVQNDRVTGLVQRRDQPEAVAGLVADRVLYGDGHPYGRPAAGYERTVRAITAADLRRHYEAHWRPNNASVVVVGDFAPEGLRASLEKAFAAWKKGPVPAAKAGAAARKRPRLVLVDKPGAPQTVLRLVGPGAARSSPDRPPLALLATVLGGSFTSRLNFNLREQKGYTYGAGSSFQFLRRPGPFTAASSVFTKVTDAALGEFLKELGALRTGDVTGEELTKARAMLQQRLAESLSTTGGTAATFADVALYGLPLDEPVRFTRALEKAQPPALRKLAVRAIDPATITIVAVGDRKTIEPGLRALGLPAPELRDADGEPVSSAPAPSPR
ncbi:MAG TPA: pitrilysin family protein [Polyangia bacterium]|nr:pitrilysin family protein [Polyangia bacterium]